MLVYIIELVGDLVQVTFPVAGMRRLLGNWARLNVVGAPANRSFYLHVVWLGQLNDVQEKTSCLQVHRELPKTDETVTMVTNNDWTYKKNILQNKVGINN